MASSVTKPVEVKFAYAFLRAIHANLNNTYLLLAVIAWVRSESGSTYRGNNPLNIRNSPYASGSRATQGNGHFAIFANLDVAAKASAALLTAVHGVGYDLMLAAAQRGATGAPQQQGQAIDFMLALALSKWDAGHYGLSEVQRADPNSIFGTTLYKVWAGLTGHPVTIPAAVINPPKPQPKRPKPASVPAVLQPPPRRREYTVAETARAFYEARHKPTVGAPGDPLATGL